MKLTSSIKLRPDLLYAAPLLNLVLLLLVFFLLNSSMVVRSGIAVTLPDSRSALKPLEDPDFVTLTLGSPPGCFFNREPATLETLAVLVKASPSKSRHVIINADPALPHGEVVRALNIILSAGREASIGTRLQD